MLQFHTHGSLAWTLALLIAALPAGAAETAGTTQGNEPITPTATAGTAAATTAAEPAGLPRTHEYQRVLREYLASLTAEDLQIEIQPFGAFDPAAMAPAEKHRVWALRLLVPPFDVSLPAEQFLLSSIETAEGVALPPISPEATAWLSQWDHAVNPYHGDTALKRRAFVWAAVDLMMLDQWHEQGQGRRSDYLGGTLIWLAYTYGAVKDALPEAARTAYETGLRKMVGRLEQWGPTGSMTDMDLFAPVGLYYAGEALDDPAVRELARAYSRPLFTNPRYFDPAGYFVDVGAFDASYNGISLYFAAHAAAATRWDFATEALSRAYELRGYLLLPEPGGGTYGPAHFSPRTSAGTDREQWNRGVRHTAAALFSDHAMPWVTPPTEEAMNSAIAAVNQALQQRNKPRQAKSQPWKETHWSSDLNYVYDNYLPGFYERALQVAQEQPELRRTPFRREGTFIRNFNDKLLIARLEKFGVVLHTGPVGRTTGRLYGFSGGALSAFWTPETGSVLMGRRSGSQGSAKPDDWGNWRLWPVHAATGIIANGRAFSTARIVRPQAAYTVSEGTAAVEVAGQITAGNGAMPDTLTSPIDYRRRFELSPAGLTIETHLTAADSDELAELYEILPVFFGSGEPKAAARILLSADEGWIEAAPEPRVTGAIRIERYQGAVEITLDRPRPVRLSPEMWRDQYQTRTAARNLMVDLLESAGEPVKFEGAAVRYTITPAPREEPEPAP